MRYRLFLLIVIAAACAFPQDTSARTRREKRRRPQKKEFSVKQTQFFVTPRLTVGVLSGSAASDIERIREGSIERMFYGLGATVEYNLTLKSSIGLNTDVLWKKLPSVTKESENKPIRVVSISGSWLLKFSTLKRNSVYARIGVGRLWAKIPEYFVMPQNGTRDMDLGRRSFYRVGIGLMTYNTPTAAMRIEVWHKTVLSGEFPDGQHYDRLSRYRYSITSVGLELAFGFGL